jgi:hypothetical protein
MKWCIILLAAIFLLDSKAVPMSQRGFACVACLKVFETMAGLRKHTSQSSMASPCARAARMRLARDGQIEWAPDHRLALPAQNLQVLFDQAAVDSSSEVFESFDHDGYLFVTFIVVISFGSGSF